MVWTIKAPKYKPHASQFINGLKGACTLTALAACDVIAKGQAAYVLGSHAADTRPDSVENVQAVTWRIYVEARQHGLCGSNGAANEWDMLEMAGVIGLPVLDYLPYADPLPYEVWLSFLRRYIAHSDKPYPVLVQVRNGRALKDAETGQEDEKDLLCHAFTLYGTQTDPSNPLAGGYIGCDGDNPAINVAPVVYSQQVLTLAEPISMIAFNYVGG